MDRNGDNADEDVDERVIRRSGTLNELENGFRHTKSDSVTQQRLSNDESAQKPSSGSPTRRSAKTPHHSIRQAFFIVSGGLAIETKSFRKEPYLTVTPRGAVELARLGLLEPVPEEIIDDKTKADPITKVVVSIQAGWFIVQCIARVAQHLPLSLLEIHTLAHVFIALLMYLFWYSKPYNALSPVVLTEPEAVQTAALFTLAKQGLRTRLESKRCLLSDELDLAAVNITHLKLSVNGGQPTNDKKTLKTAVSLNQQAEDVDEAVGGNNQGSRSISIHNENDPGITSEASATADVVFQTPPNAQSTQASSQDDHTTRSEAGTSSPASEQKPPSHLETHSHDQSKITHQSNLTDSPILEDQPNGSLKPQKPTGIAPNRLQTTLHLAQLAIQRIKTLKVHFIYSQDPGNYLQYPSTYLIPMIADFVQTPGCQLDSRKLRISRRSRQYRSLYDFLPSKPWSLWVLILLVSYAAFHLSAWNAHFPTPIERWMWRAAGLSIVGMPIYLLVGGLSAIAPKRFWRVTQACSFLNIGIVSASRLYLLVEAFVSLREPGLRIYETVEWTQFWPHG